MRVQVFNPEEVLEVAEHLLSQEGEASARSAVSRAYYGVFLFARNLANIDDESPSAHVDTWRYYIDSGEGAVADGLRQLRLRRNVADYKTDRTVSPGEGVEALKVCRRTRAALKRIAGRAKYRPAAAASVIPE
jgi:uncharacterized protein (UPF0332 family)